MWAHVGFFVREGICLREIDVCVAQMFHIYMNASVCICRRSSVVYSCICIVVIVCVYTYIYIYCCVYRVGA